MSLGLGTLFILLQYYDNMRYYHEAIDTSRNYFNVSLWQFEPSYLPAIDDGAQKRSCSRTQLKPLIDYQNYLMGTMVGPLVGDLVGTLVGPLVGNLVGTLVGPLVGDLIGDLVGLFSHGLQSS
jgi:uncharacterized membrane protein